MQIQTDNDEVIILTTGQSRWLSEINQRELIRWFFQNKPELIREIVCEECPEHLEHANYCENKLERGK